MAIPSSTINDTIIRSFYLINEYSPEELPTAYEISEGLDYLNELLDNLSANSIYIPYTNDITFNLVAQQAKYIFSPKSTADVNTTKIVVISDAYITYDNIRVPLVPIQHDDAFQLARYPQAYTRPSQYFMQNTNDETHITFYATPDRSYEVTLRAKQLLGNLVLQQEITGLPLYYRRFLRYALARELASVFETNSWTDIKEKEYTRMLNDLRSASDIDWSLNVSNVLRKKRVGWTKASIIVG